MSSQIDEAQPEEAVADAIAQPPDTGLAKRILEAALLSAQDPVSIIDMKKMFESSMSNDELRKLLDDLRDEWSDRSI
ncbi:MAG: hypothetical protein WCC58_08830, partial [Burkholderiales bacterium]